MRQNHEKSLSLTLCTGDAEGISVEAGMRGQSISFIKFLIPNNTGYNKHYLVSFHTLLRASSYVHRMVSVELEMV